MKKFLTIITVIFLSGCQATITKNEAFPKLYSEKPKTILVVPAVNNTTAADAAELYSTTIAQPLSEAGYYVVSIPFVEHFLQREGISDGEQAKQIPPEKFLQLFGADAVLFVNINSWDTNYYITGGNVTVSAKFELISTKTNNMLWQYDDIIVHDTSGNSGNLLVDVISTALTTALVDYVPIARQVNSQIVSSLPVGQYHPRHGKDNNDSGIVASKVTN
ncbi:GNA1162 family protein [Thalassotalea maritima]|uniref:GNA1162 family protein n=1 Tax=Thalassotalea maritima TaxID=3242416 RepID=UPI00352970DC